MAKYEADISVGNEYRKKYIDSLNGFIEKKYADSFKKRDVFIKDITGCQEEYRKKFIEMIGQPLNPYPDNVPRAITGHMGKDDLCDIYYLQIETMPDFWFFGILMVPFNIVKAPLVIAQHGGGGTAELCSDFLGENNYDHFIQKALERGMVVFAPQLSLWDFNIENADYDRIKINDKLRHLGLSITGLEVFFIRRSIDYLHSLEYTDESRTAMMGLSYGGYFSLYTAAADTRIKSIYAAAFFNDRTKINFRDWIYDNAANTFCDAEITALCAPRRLQIDVGKKDSVFDFSPSVKESERASFYYALFDASDNFRFNLWNGGHHFDDSGKGFDFFFDGI